MSQVQAVGLYLLLSFNLIVEPGQTLTKSVENNACGFCVLKKPSIASVPVLSGSSHDFNWAELREL